MSERMPLPAAAVPKTMKAAVLYGPGDVRIEERPVPEPGPGEALVRLRASGICGSDLMDWYVRQKAPFVFGHEPAGDVVALGEPAAAGGSSGDAVDPQPLRVGDRVALHHHAPCFDCDECFRGAHVHCATWRRNALRPGGMAEYAVVDANAVRRDTLVIPESVSYEAATLVEPAACVVKALTRARLQPGQRVLVIGLGFTGQLFGFLARRSGASTVAGVDSVPMRRAVAKEHWADDVYGPQSGSMTGAGADNVGPPPEAAFDLVVVTPGSSGAIVAGLAATRNGGTTLLFAPTGPGEDVPMPVHDMFFREIHVVTSYSAAPADMRSALTHVVAGALPEDVLITHRFSLEEAAEAYRRAQIPDEAIKIVVTP